MSYCSVVGVRWGVLTDGRQLQVYDASVVGVKPADRLVLQIDLADYADRDDFDTRIWPAASMLSKEAMATADDLERHAARELIRTILADASSASVTALRQRTSRKESDCLVSRDGSSCSPSSSDRSRLQRLRPLVRC